MTSAIGCSSSSMTTSLADRLFARLDTQKQGYLSKSDLATALGAGGASSPAATSTSTTGTEADKIFTALDSDGDGKVTKQELSDALDKVAEQLGMQRLQAGSGGPGGAGGPHGPEGPGGPPPGGKGDAGLDKDQLSAMADSTSDASLSSDLKAVVAHFDADDTNGDGKVSFQEAQAYQQKTEAAQGQDASATASASGAGDGMLRNMLQLIARYADAGSDASAKATASVAVVA